MTSVSSKKPAKQDMHILLPLLLLCLGVGNVSCLTIHGNGTDLKSLLEFKNGITNDPYGALSNWNTSTHFCRWNGVNCSSTRPYRVRELTFTGQNLAGVISSSIANLTFISYLDLSNNSFHGPIPLLNKLQNLKYLNLGSNLLHGFILDDALTNCSNLIHLDLSENNLTGVIPPKIGFLNKIEFISLYSNDLTGVIPPPLGNITTLRVVSLALNQLNGRIPNELWHMQSIVQLYLDENNLLGGIPQILSNISSLQELSLTSNMLGDTLPTNIGDALPNLQLLYLGLNNFEGRIPASIGNPPDLHEIELSNNHFVGQIPSSFGKLVHLNYLNLAGNHLEATDSEGWEFLHALGNCSLLTQLILSNNKLQGALPNSIANLSTNLTYLQMGGNHLSGTVPSSIQKFNGLIDLTLDYNNLSGTIDDWIGKLKNLQHLNLQSNNFIGKIPPSVSNLKNLTFLSLAKNKFTGFVTPSLGNLKQMLTLNLSYNNFRGSIPVEFGNFKQLTTLDLSSNRFSGEIPETMGQFQQIYSIRMDQNVLTGNIPITFSNLKSLSMFNLSHNNLSGPIPAYLKDLESLTKLDLSFNNFQGEIPRDGVFNNAAIVSLGSNPGLCGGAMDFHEPSCRLVCRREKGIINYLVEILVPIFGFMSLIMLIYVTIHGKTHTPRRSDLSLLSFGKKFPRVSYKHLAQATGNFSESNLIGRGSYGSVYTGKLTQAEFQVAIKVFNLETKFAAKSFVSECEALRTIRHRNLLPTLTACSTIDNNGNNFKALIYEFMPNRNLDTWLHQKRGGVAPKLLGLAQRISISVDVADALAYLHHDCGSPIVHCDLKPTNILLDDDMNAHLGDFGIARLVVDSRSVADGHSGGSSSLAVTGTIGYIAPEYAQTVHASTYGDVYSFGIVLLEMITGKRPTDSLFDGELNIVISVERNFPDQVLHIIDAHLPEECKGFIKAAATTENTVYRCILSFVEVALACTRPFPRERMSMREVAINLHAIRKSYVAAIKCC
ncbi:unnamed protein product, partial [Urochloa humidicola]